MTRRKMYRSRENRMVWGVAGGLAEHLDVDPVLVRVGFVILAFVSGLSVLTYVLLTILVPNEPEGAGGYRG